MKSDLFSGRYLFHFHTVVTDGKLVVGDYFDYARKNDLNQLIFLEHIRRAPTYDPLAFANEVRAESDRRGIPAAVGFEAKLLPNGEIDISPEHLELADVVGLAEHGFSDDAVEYQTALDKALCLLVKTAETKPTVWVHPGLWYMKRGLLAAHWDAYRRTIYRAQEMGIYVEHNSRYKLAPPELWPEMAADLLVFGADAHSRSDLDGYNLRFRL